MGRDAELAQLDAVLARGAPALVLVTGSVGIGKTSVVRALQRRAADAGWRLAPEGGQTSLTAGWSTTPTDFAASLRRVLDDPRVEDDPTAGLASALAGEAPVLIAVELYRPSGGFLDWLHRDLMAELRSIGAAIVVVATSALQLDEQHLEGRADMVLRLGPLESHAVRAALDELPSLDPPLEEAERAVYVDEASASPAVLTGLLRILPLAAEEPT